MDMKLERSYWPADTTQPILDLATGQLLREAAAEEPDHVALIEATPPGPPLVPGAGDRRWTYRELLAEAEQAGQWLLDRFRPGERIAIWAPNIPEWIILQYGAALAGLVIVTVNPALRSREVEYVLGQSGAVGVAYIDQFRGVDMAAVIDELAPRLPGLRERIRFSHWATEVGQATVTGHPWPAVAPRDPAQVQYTSGTTGSPKGAILHHQGLVTNAFHVNLRGDFPRYGVRLTAIPLFHSSGCGLAVLGTAVSRGTLVLAQVFDPTLYLEAIQRHQVRSVSGVPTMLAAMFAHPAFDSYDIRSARVVSSGGDKVPAAIIDQSAERMGATFSIVYGQTELSPVLTQTSPTDTRQDQIETVGRPLWQVEVKIIEPESGEIVPLGKEGEICARGYQLMLEYLDKPDETARTIDADGWLHTGDAGVLDERGYLRITGRIKDMIIRGGENIYPVEIEQLLQQHPKVAEAAVIGVPDAHWGERIAAVVRPAHPDDLPTAAELHQFVREHLAPYKTPAQWFRTDDPLPRNAMGKMQKFRLRESLAGEGMEELAAEQGSGTSA